MAIVDFNSYSIEAEWLLTWYPIRSGADVKTPQIRGGTIKQKNTDPVFEVGNRSEFRLGQGSFPGDALSPNDDAVAFISFAVDPQDYVFQVELEVRIGAVRRTKSFVLPPDTRFPFLINALSGVVDQNGPVAGVAFQGVITTGHRFGLSDAVAQIFRVRP